MSKYTICALLLLLGVATATTIATDIQITPIPVCGPNQYRTPSGCWNSCTDPKYSTCPDVFITLYDPSFCAYTRDGQYVSYTFDCQACQNTNVLAVRNGVCSCDLIRCGLNEVCQNGQCIQQIPIDPLPCTKLCIIGTVCRNGQCVLETPADKCALIKCGFGTVCRDGQCVFVTPNPCLTIKCSPGFICNNGVCIKDIVPLDPCAYAKCGASAFCENGQCVADRCPLIRCRQGFECKKNRCVAQEGLCGVQVCAPEYVCLNGQCTLPLDQPTCPAKRIQCTYPRPNETTCPTIYHIVAPTPNFCGVTSTGEQIGYEFECQACKDKSVQYYWTRRCEQIQLCVQLQTPQCTVDNQCQTGYSCMSQRCVDRCAVMKCYPGTRCVQGQCVPDVVVDQVPVGEKCLATTCLIGTYCVNGVCVPLYPGRSEIVVDLCAGVTCLAPSVCVDGGCVVSK